MLTLTNRGKVLDAEPPELVQGETRTMPMAEALPTPMAEALPTATDPRQTPAPMQLQHMHVPMAAPTRQRT